MTLEKYLLFGTVFLVWANVLGGLFFHFSKKKIIDPKWAIRGHIVSGLIAGALGLILIVLEGVNIL